MRIARLISAGLISFGLAAGTAQAAPFNAATELQDPERGVFAILESYLSTAAGAVASHGACFPYNNLVVIAASANGDADGAWGDYELTSSIVSNTTNGTLHKVEDDTPPGNIGTLVKVLDYYTTPFHAFSRFGDLFIDKAKFVLKRGATVAVPWDEVSIKDFYIGGSGDNCTIIDKGLEAITKQGFPLAKWKEDSWYKRNACSTPGDPKQDMFRVEKERIFPGGATCRLIAQGEFVCDGVNCDILGFISIGP